MTRYFVTGTHEGTGREFVLFRSPRSARGPAQEWVRQNCVRCVEPYGVTYFGQGGKIYSQVAVRIEVPQPIAV